MQATFALVVAGTLSIAAIETSGDGNWYLALVNAGPIGAILLWFMLRLEKKMTEQNKSMDRFSEALLLLVTAPVQPCPVQNNEAVIEQARKKLAELRSENARK
jgi:peptidoglycan biosynthesis protein MviN/MurJ (putative lipid II flippase)